MTPNVCLIGDGQPQHHLWSPFADVSCTTFGKGPVSAVFQATVQARTTEVHDAHHRVAIWTFGPHEVVRLHVAVHHPSLAQLVQATQAANGHGAEVGHVFEVLVIRSTNFHAVSTFNQRLHSVADHVEEGLNQPRKDGALGVHRFDPSANGQQVGHQFHCETTVSLDTHLGVALDVGGQIGACEVSGAHRVFDLILLAQDLSRVRPVFTGTLPCPLPHQARVHVDVHWDPSISDVGRIASFRIHRTAGRHPWRPLGNGMGIPG
mmetsp:Transcript_72336/g.159756  ORF Transcript_72336/g.159756 Transcript_72336/m.159756 type:complete len:263 (+) Transcript_72336:531-1319(+)